MVRGVDPDDPRLNGRVFVFANRKMLRRSAEDLSCERVYFAAGHGICMALADSGVGYTATIFDSGLEPLRTMPLTGLPSRARVSADGRYGAMTVFVSGDAYLGESGSFSTRTTIVDMATGERIGQLEQFEVSRDGRPFDAADFNFWGMTFAPGNHNRFYATLATTSHHYLVEGDVAARSMRVLRDGVECPSLSPDGRRIAFKSRTGDSNRWRLHVLDLADLEDHPVAERRSIDDQAEWLDDRTLVYSDGVDVFSVPADGSGASRLVLRDATSPVALRESLDPA
jgi:dipeptidyl aminopeptidase/acylaminoacyl peptidase